MPNRHAHANRAINAGARTVLAGGVNSPVRAFKHIGGDPIPVQSAKGAYLYDHDGKRYIDYALSFGVSILGHAHPSVVSSARRALTRGLAFGATCAQEVELATLITKAIPLIDRIRFVNSGTEAVMGAVRLARGHTNRDKILKFTHAYHGHADYLLIKGGSGMATLKIPASKGIPRNFFKDTLIADYGDYNALEDIFKKYGDQIAAVLVEPVGGNYGVLAPDTRFLKYLRHTTKKHGSLLIFDEVITGFRFHYGSAAQILGVRPDIICLGKIIGGGLPVGAYGGAQKIMRSLAPEGEVYQASTFAGNPIVMASGVAALKALRSERGGYRRLSVAAKSICDTIETAARAMAVRVSVSLFKNMFSVRFDRKGHFSHFYRGLLSESVYFAPSEYEADFLSFAHTASDTDKTKRAIKNVFRDWDK